MKTTLMLSPFLIFLAQCISKESPKITKTYKSFVTPGVGCVNPSSTTQIPKIIHQVWHDFGKGKQPDEELSRWSEEIKNKYPTTEGWTHHLWDNTKSRAFIETNEPDFLAVYDSYTDEIKKVDAIRYIFLKHMGGFYLDFDMKFIRPVNEALAGCSVVLGEENDTHMLNNAFMATVEKHPFWDVVIETMKEHANKGKDKGSFLQEVLFETGPDMISIALSKYISAEPLAPEFKVYPPEAFFKTLPKNCRKDSTPCAEEFPNTYFMQLYAASWL